MNSISKLKDNGLLLRSFDDGDKTEEMCLAAVRQCGDALEYVPEHLKTIQVCLAAVSNNGTSLKYVPDHLKIYEICLAAINNYGCSIVYVPKEIITQEMCLCAASNSEVLSCDGGRIYDYIPEGFKTKEFYLEAAKYSIRDIIFVDKDKFSEYEWATLILSNYSNYDYICERLPREIRNDVQKIVEKNIKHNSCCLNYDI